MRITSSRSLKINEDDKPIMQRLRAYIEPVDCTWFENLKPAKTSQIEELKRQLDLDNLGLQFSKSFLSFLYEAGEGAGGLFCDFLHAEISVSNLLSQNTCVYINEADSMKPYCFDFLQDSMGICYSMNLDENNQKIYMEETYEISDNFEKLLFQCAVHRYEREYYLHTTFFSASQNSFYDSKIGRSEIDLFDYLHQVIKQYQSEKAWFSDKFNFFAYNDEMSFILNRSGVGFYGYIYFDDMKLLHEMQKGWLAETGARLQRINENKQGGIEKKKN